MKKERRDKSFIHKPTYPGGKKAMELFIKDNLQYPKEAVKAKIEGSVQCRYRITHEGKVDDVKIISGLGNGCDEEAIRLIKLFRFELPQIPRGLKAHFHKNIRINFKLPVQQIAKQPAQKSSYQYTLAPPKNKPKIQPTKENKNKVYRYTITVK